MFSILKQIFLWLYFQYVRSSKRKLFIDIVTSNCKKRKYVEDIPNLCTVLDEVTELPNNFVDTVSFIGFDRNAHILTLQLQRYDSGEEAVFLDIDMPGYGHFSYKELNTRKKNMDFTENLCSSTRINLTCHQPMRRWKIRFSGPMKQTVNGCDRHVTLSVYWQCLSDPYDHFTSSSCWALAGNLSSLSLKDMLTVSFNEKQICYEQLGEIRARIEIDSADMLNIRLKTVKERIFNEKGSQALERLNKQYIVLEKTGLFLSTQRISLGNCNVACLGYVLFPFGDLSPTKQIESTSQMFPKIVTACGNVYQISEKLKKFCFDNSAEKLTYFKYKVCDRPAFGIQCDLDSDSKYDKYESPIEARYFTASSDVEPKEDIMLVTFDDSACKTRSLVGGKGSQLAILRSLEICNVPNGICLTSNAYRKHVTENSLLISAVNSISKCVQDDTPFKLKEQCENAVDLFHETSLESNLKTSIWDLLGEIFGNEILERQKFAVRSSSVNEDGSQASSAGQLDTFLCVQGLENIFNAVIKCWASSLSYQVVEYRRQNGQILTEDMGVVIQEMIKSDVAGVVFTNDPVSGDASRMIINAALGLGESVVSGKVTPDTIIVKRKDNKVLTIEKVKIGEKEFRIVDNHGGGITEVVNADADKEKLCLQDSEIIQLCETAIEIENYFNTAQDIEWAMSLGKIYILQTRPVTALDFITDEEIMHEFDSPVISDIELITPCNVQEAIPGAVTPLSSDILLPAVDRSVKYNVYSRLGLQHPVHVSKLTLSFSGMGLFGITGLIALVVNGLAGERAKSGAEASILGMSVAGHTVEGIKDFYGRKTSWVTKLKNAATDYLILSRTDSALYERLKQEVKSFSLGEGATTAEVLYEAIDDNLWFYSEMWRATTSVTASSGMRSMLVMGILKGSSSETSANHSADMALILSECKNVCSAEVPTAINSLAKLIARSEFKQTFVSLPLDECDAFLKTSTTEEIKTEYTKFLERHGHRSIRESDFFEKSWKQEPSKLMKMLKQIVQQSTFQDKQKKTLSVDEIVESLKTPLSPFKKRLLKRYFIKSAMDGVAQRELAKSDVIKSCSIFKEAYWKLAAMMVRECRIPEENILFFLTHKEIGTLIKHRSIKLIRLAKRRMKLLPEMNKIKFDKVNFGVPIPVKAEIKEITATCFTLDGMPVCRGKASGRACSVQTLEDADQIVEGDILICRYTDVGWSPYFPLINGLVTEMGGLISHGAVVAREYGIPCIVNVTNATELIKTGDMVTLDGTLGTISKL